MFRFLVLRDSYRNMNKACQPFCKLLHTHTQCLNPAYHTWQSKWTQTLCWMAFLSHVETHLFIFFYYFLDYSPIWGLANPLGLFHKSKNLLSYYFPYGDPHFYLQGLLTFLPISTHKYTILDTSIPCMAK